MSSEFKTAIEADVVVIDDEESMCEGCRQTLELGGYRTAVAMNGKLGIELVQKSRPKIVIVDLKMPGLSGVEVLSQINQFDQGIVPIVITGYATVDSAVETMKVGAFDFLAKPFEPEKLMESVNRAMEIVELRRQMAQPAAQPKKIPDRQDVLLKGVETMGEYYALPERKQTFFEELADLESELKHYAGICGQRQADVRQKFASELRLVDDIIERFAYKKNTLIQILLSIQQKLNWLPRHTLKWVSLRLQVPLAQVYTIVNFYDALSLKPQGKHKVQVCMGTACHVRGSVGLMQKVSGALHLDPGETDAAHNFSLEAVHCLGCCALAPVVKVDDQYYKNPRVGKLRKIFDQCQEPKEES